MEEMRDKQQENEAKEEEEEEEEVWKISTVGLTQSRSPGLFL